MFFRKKKKAHEARLCSIPSLLERLEIERIDRFLLLRGRKVDLVGFDVPEDVTLSAPRTLRNPLPVLILQWILTVRVSIPIVDHLLGHTDLPIPDALLTRTTLSGAVVVQEHRTVATLKLLLHLILVDNNTSTSSVSTNSPRSVATRKTDKATTEEKRYEENGQDGKNSTSGHCRPLSQ